MSEAAATSLSDNDIHTEWQCKDKNDMHECRIERIWLMEAKERTVEFIRDDATRTDNLTESQFLAAYYRKPLDPEKYPEGKISPDDEGALSIMIGVQGDLVVLEFNKLVAWFGMGPDQAEVVGNSLLNKAAECRAQVTGPRN